MKCAAFFFVPCLASSSASAPDVTASNASAWPHQYEEHDFMERYKRQILAPMQAVQSRAEEQAAAGKAADEARFAAVKEARAEQLERERDVSETERAAWIERVAAAEAAKVAADAAAEAERDAKNAADSERANARAEAEREARKARRDYNRTQGEKMTATIERANARRPPDLGGQDPGKGGGGRYWAPSVAIIGPDGGAAVSVRA